VKPPRLVCLPDGSPESPHLAALLAVRGYRRIAPNGEFPIFIGDDSDALLSRDGRIAIIGTIFGLEPDWDADLCFAQVASPHDAVRKLFRRSWGSYLVVLIDDDRQMYIARDPSGTMPCYVLKHAGSPPIGGTHVRDLFACSDYRPTINWHEIARHLAAIQYRDSETALNDVVELLPGFMAPLSSNGAPIPLWSPWDFAHPRNFITDTGEASDRLRETALHVIGAWGRRFSHVLIGLSGGLDSSIVSAGLVNAGVACSGLTLMSGTMSGDERDYARLVATALEMPLHEEPLSGQQVGLEISFAAHVPRPIGRLFWQAADRIFADVGSRSGADGHFHGAGGDNVFCYLQSVAPILDRLHTEGPGRGAAATFRDICALTESDIWDAAGRTFRRLWSGRRQYRWAIDEQMLTNRAIELATPVFDHPWLQVPPHALAGSAAHIALLLAIQNYLEGYRRELVTPIVAPLMSQPLVELCLQIPSWMWCEGGQNRSVARRAFAGLLPEPVLGRRSKGTPDGYSMEIFERNRRAIRELLNGGLLVREGLIDIDAVNQCLADNGPVRGDAYARILCFCDFEAWLRSWS
jgi:asparagine synthase (glutamine-hydrolysing)